MQLFQYQTGYRYNSDSLLLYDFVATCKPKGQVLDIGSGCGILGLLIKRDFPHVQMSSIDVQQEHFELTCKNATHNHLDILPICADVLEYDFTSKFECIISNPPFYHKSSLKSEDAILSKSRYADALPFELLAKKVAKILKFRGSFIFCYDAKQLDMLLCSLVQNSLKPTCMRFVHTKKSKDASLVLIEAKKDSKSLLKVLAPLYMYDDAHELTQEVAEIYKKSKTKSEICQV